MSITTTMGTRFATLAIVLVAALGILSGCGKADDRTAGPGSSGPASSASSPTSTNGTGRLTMVLHDAPTAEDIDELRVRLAKVRVRLAGEEGWTELPANPEPFDLLILQNGKVLQVLANAALPHGQYDELRLVLAEEPVVIVDGTEYGTNGPSDMTSGFKVKGAFEIVAGLCTTISVDFDGRKSLKPNLKHGFILEPVAHIDDAQVVPCANQPPSEPESLSTPEETLKVLAEALEAEDGQLAASYFAISVRQMYHDLFQQADLKALAKDLHDFPPVPTLLGSRYAEFRTFSTATGEPIPEEISLHLEEGQWRIVTF